MQSLCCLDHPSKGGKGPRQLTRSNGETEHGSGNRAWDPAVWLVAPRLLSMTTPPSPIERPSLSSSLCLLLSSRGFHLDFSSGFHNDACAVRCTTGAPGGPQTDCPGRPWRPGCPAIRAKWASAQHRGSAVPAAKVLASGLPAPCFHGSFPCPAFSCPVF